MIAIIFSAAFATQILRIAIPYVLAALGGAITERSGVIDLALEAKLLFGAFAAAAVGHATDSPMLGLAAGIAAGAMIAAIQLGLALWLDANQVIVGVALNVLALAGTRFLLQIIFDEGSNSPYTPGFGDAVLSSPIAWLAGIAAIAVPFALRRTTWGLRLRAAGDRPDALVAVGISPTRTRLYAGLVGGALAGAGGAQLSLSVNGFSADMAGGRGYIALAMVILSGWRPAWAAIACVGVALGESLRIYFQVADVAIPRELAPLVPYVLTLVVLVVVGGKRWLPPASLGK